MFCLIHETTCLVGQGPLSYFGNNTQTKQPVEMSSFFQGFGGFSSPPVPVFVMSHQYGFQSTVRPCQCSLFICVVGVSRLPDGQRDAQPD